MWARGDSVRNIFLAAARKISRPGLTVAHCCARHRSAFQISPVICEGISLAPSNVRFALVWARGDLNSQSLRNTLLKRTCIPFHHAPNEGIMPEKYKKVRPVPVRGRSQNIPCNTSLCHYGHAKRRNSSYWFLRDSRLFRVVVEDTGNLDVSDQ